MGAIKNRMMDFLEQGGRSLGYDDHDIELHDDEIIKLEEEE